MDPEDEERPQETNPAVSPALAGAAAFEGIPIVLSPLLGDVPHGLATLLMSGKPIEESAGTPLARLAEFTRGEANAIRDFAEQQGVRIPIVAAGPGLNSGYFYDGRGPLSDLIARVMGTATKEEIGPHIGLSTTSLPHAFHEIGHASPLAGSDTLRTTLQGLGRTLGTGSAIGHLLRAGIAASLLQQPDENTPAAQRFVHDNAPALVGATMVPELAEEARASYNAIQGARRAGMGTMGSLRELAPAFGTYLAAAAAPVIATLFAKKLIDALRASGAKPPSEEAKTAAPVPGEVKAPGLLRSDASNAWRIGGSPPKPKTIPPARAATGAPAKGRAAAAPPSKQAFYTDMLKTMGDPGRGFRQAKPPTS